MKAMGLEYVRIGEFMWSTIEPSYGAYNWSLLDDAFRVLSAAGLRIVLGTPTATPPSWLISMDPSILPVDRNGRARQFGSRRHYAFSSRSFHNHTRRIVTELATRYGTHEALAGWQLDNEYGCHDTVHSYDNDALDAFRVWLRTRYSTITELNDAWGNSFWSMAYNTFDEVQFPVGTVTEANPSHWLDYYRFASDAVIAYNKIQADILRVLSPGKYLTTNLMGWYFDFDAFKLGLDLDFVTWDSYPLGFTDTTLGIGELFTEKQKITFGRTGHPDLASFHHDLYRAVGKGLFQIAEQQPGPVNWAGNNPSPARGMVRLWTWEAFAHGADVVSYFRWRQSPFAQEQMHAGLNRRDYYPDIGHKEASQVHEETARVANLIAASATQSPRVAIAFDYESVWYFQIQPQGNEWSYIRLVYLFYSTVRQLGVEVDFIPLNNGGVDVGRYDVIIIPSLAHITPAAVSLLESFKGHVIMGPRSGSKTNTFQIPRHLAPSSSNFNRLLPIIVERVESLRAGVVEDVTYGESEVKQTSYSVGTWKEWISINSTLSSDRQVSVAATFAADDTPALVVSSSNTGGATIHYFASWPNAVMLRRYLARRFNIIGIPYHHNLGDYIRVSRRGQALFVFNYAGQTQDMPISPMGPSLIGGGADIAKYDVSIWQCNEPTCWSVDDGSRASILLLMVLVISGFVFLGCSVLLYNRVKQKRKSYNTNAIPSSASVNNKSDSAPPSPHHPNTNNKHNNTNVTFSQSTLLDGDDDNGAGAAPPRVSSGSRPINNSGSRGGKAEKVRLLSDAAGADP